MAVQKYTIFNLENEFYAIPISKIQEIISFTPITPLHDVSNFLKGVINLRGRIIPVIDLRLKFGLPEKPYTDRTIFIIVELISGDNTSHIGLIVDSIREVVEIDDQQIEKTAEKGYKFFKGKYLHGITQINNNMIMILNLENILSTEEIIEINKQTDGE